MDSSIKKNYIYNTIYQILLIIIPLITTPYIARVLGADGVGINSYIGAVVSYFSLFAMLGTATYGQRELSFLQNDRHSRSITFWEIEILNALMVFICSVVYAVFVFFQNSNRLLYIIYGIQLLTVLLDITWLYTAMEDFKTTVTRSILIKIITVLSIFLFVRNKNDLWIYILLTIGVNCLGYLSFWVSIKKHVDYIFVNIRPFKHFRGTVALFIPTLAIQLYMQMDKIMIGILTDDPFQNGYYEQSLKLIRMLLTVVASLSTVMIPRIGHYISENRYDDMTKMIYKIINFVLMIGFPLCFGIISIISGIIPWFFGEGYDSVSLITYCLAPQIVIVGLNNITAYQCLIPQKKQGLFTISVCAGAVFNLIANILLIPKLGAVGAAIASTIAELVVLSVELYILRNMISIKLVIKMSRNYLSASIVMLLAIFFVCNYLEKTILSTLIMVVLGICIYILVLLFLKDDFFKGNITKLLLFQGKEHDR